MKAKPTFLVVGAAKSATTSLCDMLSRHPQVCFSVTKEVRYFSHDENYAKGWSWYIDHFKRTAEHVAVGEGSVHYSMKSHSPLAVERIAQALPDVKIVYLVRHPLDRLLSHYRMYERSCNPKFVSFENDLLSARYFKTLLEPSLYWLQLNVFRAKYPDERIHVIFLDDLQADPTAELVRLSGFLGIEHLPHQQLALRHLNSNAADQRKISRLAGDTYVGTSFWTRRAHRFAIELLTDDSGRFLAHNGKPTDFWLMDRELANMRMQLTA